MGFKSLVVTVLGCILLHAIAQKDPFLWLNYPNEDGSLFRIYSSDHLVVYRPNQSEVNETVVHLFPILSKAWQYVKESYTPYTLSPNYRLYFLLNDSHKGCLKPVKWLEEFKLPEIDRCDESRSSNLTNGFRIIQPISAISMLQALGKLVQINAKEFPTIQDFQLCGDQLSDIVAYDISTHLNNNGINNTYNFQWYQDILKNAGDDDAKCFQNIFLPIFKTYGNPALAKYFSYTSTYWSKSGPFMNLGEFVHYWSGSAGVNVLNFVKQAFNWTSGNDKELTHAQEMYPYFLYRVDPDQNEVRPTYVLPQTWSEGSSEATNLFYRDFTSEYFNSYTQKSQLLNRFEAGQMQFVSNVWTFFISNYGSVGPKKVLHLVIWSRGRNSSSSCISSNLRSFIDPVFGMDNVVSCPDRGHSTENVNTMSLFLHELGKMALKLSNGTGNWPLVDVSGWTMSTILVFDYALSFKVRLEAKRGWKFHEQVLLYSQVEGKGKSLLRPGSILFYDWYVPIHSKHGTGKVLKRFFQLLSSNWPISGNNYVGQLNLGEFVHFWNAAANQDLRSNASHVFNWKAEHEELFYKAREDFPKLNTYQCLDCKRRPTDSKVTPGEGSTTVAWVVGVSISIFILAAFAVGSKFWLYNKRIVLLSNQIRNLTTKEVDEFIYGTSVGNQEQDSDAPIYTRAFNNVYEVPKEMLVIDGQKSLGSGEFGVVYSGFLKTVDDTNEAGCSSMQVAVKTVKPDVEVSYFKAMLSEIKIMAFLGHHKNLVSLLGTVTSNIKNREVFVALEFCSKGDLLQHLRKFEDNFSDLWVSEIGRNPQCLYTNVPVHPLVPMEPSITSSSYKNAKTISTIDLLEWSRQISNGMAYLTSRKVIHGDLAARNVLLTDKNVAKISDFGLSRQLINYSKYLKTSNTPLPWRWLAIETLTKQELSLNSDIWSFGVTLWEIFTLGKLPYPGRTWDPAFVGYLRNGQRLPAPEFGNDEIYTLMMNCMRMEPVKRISFQEIMIQIDSIKNRLGLTSQPKSAETHYLALSVEIEP